jgi:hypothetical protein
MGAVDRKKLHAVVMKLTKKFGDQQWHQTAEHFVRHAEHEPDRTVRIRFVHGRSRPLWRRHIGGTLYNSKQAAKIVGCCVVSIQRYSRSGLLPYVLIGERRRYRKSDLLRLKEVLAAPAADSAKGGS